MPGQTEQSKPRYSLKEITMKRAAPKFAHSQSDVLASHGDQSAMRRRFDRLYRRRPEGRRHRGKSSGSERPSSRSFCYGRAHLNAIGLAVAAHCNLDQLIAASGSSAAGARFVRPIARLAGAGPKTYARRRAVTLAELGVGRLRARAAVRNC